MKFYGLARCGVRDVEEYLLKKYFKGEGKLAEWIVNAVY